MQHRFLLRLHLLSSFLGVKALAAKVIVSDIGIDMGGFPSDGHLISWAGASPRNDESAGKRRSNRLRQGCALAQDHAGASAWSAVRKKDSCLRAQVYHVKAAARSEEGHHGGPPPPFSQPSITC
jgi:transposase